MAKDDEELRPLNNVQVSMEASAVREPSVPNRTLLQIYPKWQRVARLWYEGEPCEVRGLGSNHCGLIQEINVAVSCRR